jgi:hypothetical protein
LTTTPAAWPTPLARVVIKPELVKPEAVGVPVDAGFFRALLRLEVLTIAPSVRV